MSDYSTGSSIAVRTVQLVYVWLSVLSAHIHVHLLFISKMCSSSRLVLLNLLYSWVCCCFDCADIGDRLIEVVGLDNSMHVGQVYAGLRASGRRLAQCSSVVIRSVLSLRFQLISEDMVKTSHHMLIIDVSEQC